MYASRGDPEPRPLFGEIQYRKEAPKLVCTPNVSRERDRASTVVVAPPRCFRRGKPVATDGDRTGVRVRHARGHGGGVGGGGGGSLVPGGRGRIFQTLARAAPARATGTDAAQGTAGIATPHGHASSRLKLRRPCTSPHGHAPAAARASTPRPKLTMGTMVPGRARRSQLFWHSKTRTSASTGRRCPCRTPGQPS